MSGTSARLAGGSGHTITMRRTDADRRPPSRVLTARLLGDPDPDRFARAEEARQILLSRSQKAHTYVAPKIADLMRALAAGPMTQPDLARVLDVAVVTAKDRLVQARRAGLVERIGPNSKPGAINRLTELGLSLLPGLRQ